MTPSYITKLDEVQALAAAAVLEKLQKDGAALLVMPTGTGKTNVAFQTMKQFVGGQHPVLWLTHRRDLTDQTSTRATEFFKMFTVARFHGREHSFHSAVVVAMVPTLSKAAGMQKLKDYLSRSTFSLVVVDEAHRSCGSQFRRVLDVVHAAKIPCLGLTATPVRPDGQEPHPCFGDEPAFTYSFPEAEADGTVARVECRATLTDSWLKGDPNNKGEYSRKEIDRTLVIEERNRIIVDKVMKDTGEFWKQYRLRPKYLTFCVNVRHAKRMTRLFREAGLKAEFYVGDTAVLSPERRKKIFETFKASNKIDMLCSVDVLNEGVDIPDVNTLVMCRPTYSNIIYTQQLGRGLRRPKPAVLVFDFVDNYENAYGVYNASNLFAEPRGRVQVDVTYLKKKDGFDDRIVIERRIENILNRIGEYQAVVRRQLTEEVCLESAYKAKAAGATNLKGWDNVDSGAYATACRRGWIAKIRGEVFPNSRIYRRLTEEDCLGSAYKAKAAGATNLKGWYKVDPGAYVAARRRGWIAKIRGEVFSNSRLCSPNRTRPNRWRHPDLCLCSDHSACPCAPWQREQAVKLGYAKN